MRDAFAGSFPVAVHFVSYHRNYFAIEINRTFPDISGHEPDISGHQQDICGHEQDIAIRPRAFVPFKSALAISQSGFV
jgi:hypothetical protein